MGKWLLLLWLLPAAPSLAAVALQQSVESLARDSDAVVRGSVQRRAAGWRGGRIFTEVEVRVSEVWRGRAPARVTVTVPGGEVGPIGQLVAGAPSFRDGEEVVLFLKRGPAGAWGVTGLGLGKFSLAGRTARPDAGGMDVVPSPLAPGERPPEPMPVAELKRRVEEAR